MKGFTFFSIKLFAISIWFIRHNACISVEEMSVFLQTNDLEELFTTFERNRDSSDTNTTEIMLDSARAVREHLEVIHADGVGADLRAEIRAVHEEIYRAAIEMLNNLQHFTEHFERLLDTNVRDEPQQHPMHIGRGRQRISVSQGQLSVLSRLGLTWRKIAEMLGISLSTLLQRRNKLGPEEQR